MPTFTFTCTNCGGERPDNTWSVSIEPAPSRWLVGCPVCAGRMQLASTQQHGENTLIHGENTVDGAGKLKSCKHCLKAFVTGKSNQTFCCKPCHDAYWNAVKKAEAAKKASNG